MTKKQKRMSGSAAVNSLAILLPLHLTELTKDVLEISATPSAIWLGNNFTFYFLLKKRDGYVQ